MKLYQILTLILLTALPFFPRQLDPKIPYLIIAYALLLLPVAFTNIKRDLKHPLIIFFLLFLASAALSTLFSIDQKRSLIQLATYVSYFVIFTSIGSVFADTKSKERLALVFLLITSLLSLIALYNTLIANYINREIAGVSFMWVYFGHNHLSALLLFAIPIAFYFVKKSWHSPRYQVPVLVTCHLSLVTLLLVALYFSFARASMISLTAVSMIVLLSLIRKYDLKVIIGILAVFLVIIGSYQAIVNPKQFGVRKVDLRNSARVVYWQQAIENAKNHPLFGTGLDTFRFISFNSKEKALKTFYTHNFFLQMLSDTGIFGFLSSLLLIGSVLFKGAKQISHNIKNQSSIVNGQLSIVFFVALLASTLNSLVDFDWQLPTVFLIFWMATALIIDE